MFYKKDKDKDIEKIQNLYIEEKDRTVTTGFNKRFHPYIAIRLLQLILFDAKDLNKIKEYGIELNRERIIGNEVDEFNRFVEEEYRNRCREIEGNIAGIEDR